jgi:hypothetical protein
MSDILLPSCHALPSVANIIHYVAYRRQNFRNLADQLQGRSGWYQMCLQIPQQSLERAHEKQILACRCGNFIFSVALGSKR